MKKAIIIGGGPAGMMAALAAAESGHQVILLEKNEKLGKKLFITGKGRCNITNASEMEELFAGVLTNRKFLYSAFYTYDNQRVIDFFEKEGLATKTERGNRVFPVSDHSSDVIRTLEKSLKKAGVTIRLNTEVKSLLVNENRVTGVFLTSKEKISADAVVVATGGFSYQSTGSTGDGYRFAKETEHRVTSLYPALVPLETAEEYIPRMQGLSLKNIRVTIKNGNKVLFEDFGEMLFTHFGVSGPLILSASSLVGKALEKNQLQMTIDLKPSLSQEQLDQRLLRVFDEMKNKQFKNALPGLLPSKMLPVLLELSGIDPEKKLNEVTKEERMRIIHLLKNFPATITSLREFKEAIITKGGVDVKDINPSTMESKIIKDLFFAGEVLDLDAVTGGYNLQIAWSTGYLAGISLT